MIARNRELAGELVDVVQAARALPHHLRTSAELELRVEALEGRSDNLAEHVRDLATAGGDIAALVSELYVGPPCPADSEVPDA